MGHKAKASGSDLDFWLGPLGFAGGDADQVFLSDRFDGDS